MDGFFSQQEVSTKRPLPLLPNCGKCGLLKGCQTPKMPVGGEGKKKIMIIGEAPGGTEDASGLQFIGDAGQELQRFLRRHGIELHEDCWTHNALSCRPPSNKIDNPNKIEFCRPLVIQAIERYKPRVIILTGWHAMKSVLAHLWKNDIGNAAGRWTGMRIPCQQWNSWICPTWHPSFIMRQHRDPLADREFSDHLEWAVKQKERPFPNGVPNYEDQCQVVLNTNRAAKEIAKFHESKVVTFDYETNSLKPTYPGAEIYCCSVSDGKRSVAFPWHGAAITAMKELLQNPNVKKDGWNIKFEELWTRVKLGIRVKGWRWDGQIGCHLLDLRPDITSLAFQEFVHLGVAEHKDWIKAYLHSGEKNTTKLNRINELNIKDVLMYCALDSLIEFKLNRLQLKEIRDHDLH